MKKLILIIALIFWTSKINSQQLYTNMGETIFDGSKESFEPIFEQKPHEDPNSEAAKLGGEISLKAKWLKDSED